MDRAFASGTAGTPPAAPASPSIGYPTPGNPSSGVPATKPGAHWYHMITEEIRAVIVAAGLVPDHEDLTQLKDALDALYLPSSTSGYMLVRDEKSSGRSGGSTSVGANVRTLNTVVSNNIAGASLASNQVTLPAGTYRISADPSVLTSNIHRAYLYNVTDSAVAILGKSANGTDTAASEGIDSISTIRGRITIASPKVFEVRHYTNQAGNFGAAVSNSGVEVYTTLEIIKE